MRLMQLGDIDVTEDSGATVDTVRGALVRATAEELRALAPLLFEEVEVRARAPEVAVQGGGKAETIELVALASQHAPESVHGMTCARFANGSALCGHLLVMADGREIFAVLVGLGCTARAVATKMDAAIAAGRPTGRQATFHGCVMLSAFTEPVPRG